MSRAGQDATLPITVFDPHTLMLDGEEWSDVSVWAKPALR